MEQKVEPFLLSVIRGVIVDSKKVRMIADTCQEEISKLVNWSDFNINLLREQNEFDTFSPEIRSIFYTCCDLIWQHLPEYEPKKQPGQIIICSIPKDEPEISTPPAEISAPVKSTTLTNTKGNLFFDHQEMIPTKQSTPNQLSLF